MKVIPISDAMAMAERAGYRSLNQRGFYSHFLRVIRKPESICIDVVRGGIPLKLIRKAIRP